MGRLTGTAVALIFLIIAWFPQLLQTPCAAAEAELISAEQLKSLIDSHADLVVVDTRSRQRYSQGHIPGAISMHYPPEFWDRHEELPQEKIIVFYCD